MYKEDQTCRNSAERGSDDIYSKPVRAGKRTYFFDVKSTKDSSDYFLTITESKRRTEQDGSYSFDKHKIFLYKEDFEKFLDGLEEVISYMKENLLKDVPMHDGKRQEMHQEDEDRFTNITFDDIQ
ncbi:MAG: DUF3276 family protein [Candidatus Cryptobacteroides sp.]